MKRILSLILAFLLFASLPAVAEDLSLADSGFPGVWIEYDGYGTLTILADGTASMHYFDDTISDFRWALSEEGAVFTEGMWYNSPMVLQDENTLNVSNGWSIFYREGSTPITDPALLLGAEPVGEEGEPFLGGWELVSLIIEGEEKDPADIDMTMTLTFNADGTVVSDDGLEPYTTTWFVSYGNAVVEGDVLSIDENDQLIFNSYDGTMIFVRLPAEENDVPVEAVPVGEEGEAFLGTWTLESIEAEGASYAPSLLGISTIITFNEDGTATVTDDLDTQTTVWYVENDAAIVEGFPLSLNEDGKLVMTDEDGSVMIFTSDAIEPAGELSEEEQLALLLLLLSQMEDVTTEEPATINRLNTKFVCKEYSTDGVILDGSTLGAEYSVLFRDDNTADITLGDVLMKNIPYSITEDGVYAINYYGIFYNCTPTDTGFDMDYFGTMTLHLVPAE